MSSFVGQINDSLFGLDIMFDRKSVDAGLCHPTNRTIYAGAYCSLSSEECFEDFSFRSSREETQQQYKGSCLQRKNTQRVKIGQCEDGKGACASVKELCATPKSFSPSSKNCEVMMDVNPRPTIKTKYGSCVSGGIKSCFWSSGKWCDNPSSFKLDYGCNCQDVVVGGCEKDGIVFCAVNEKSCDDLSNWIQPDEIVEKTGTKCYLCRESPGATSTQLPAAPTQLPAAPTRLPMPVSAPTRAPILRVPTIPEPTELQTDPFPLKQEDTLSLNKNDGYNNNVNDNAGVIVGSISGAIAFALILIIALLYAVHRRNQRHKASRAIDSSADIDLSQDEKPLEQEII
mmetsp:Transcript_8701/g.9610  ORF Transcript_8701/g.9610 Transcript_8701/m.9610 type:complete len:343 (+) Transcript_8701:104-1132(+)